MRLFTVLGAALAAVSAGDAGIVSGARAVQSGSVSIDSRDDADEIDCSRVRIDFGDGPVARDERRLDVARASVDALRVGARNGGISVRGWDGTDYRIVACIAATGADEAEARQRLAGVTLDAHDGRLSVGETRVWSGRRASSCARPPRWTRRCRDQERAGIGARLRGGGAASRDQRADSRRRRSWPHRRHGGQRSNQRRGQRRTGESDHRQRSHQRRPQRHDVGR